MLYIVELSQQVLLLLLLLLLHCSAACAGDPAAYLGAHTTGVNRSVPQAVMTCRRLICYSVAVHMWGLSRSLAFSTLFAQGRRASSVNHKPRLQ